ncbi:hypothetical protein L3X38_031313 [Prunus dulcis]|uniref:Retrotransposon Copia-like N-terminal domain-containing protein n=1 Tax=Prunus dulcis TaxID=3755 RepID=A0AAD4VD33_PRUDU|nr:hypothetical protein L3X38_031313 [Prunus dulcis]
MATNNSSAAPAYTNDANPSSPPTNNYATPTHAAIPTISTIVTIKLNMTNYPLWLAQICLILGSHDLFGYVDGSVPCPPKHLPATNTSLLNPVYLNWVQQDQTILSWINNSLSPALLAIVDLSPTSRQT